MSEIKVVSHAFTGGQYSEELHARSDLERYDLGAKELTNFIARYSGGALKRSGTRFVEFSSDALANVRCFPFRFSEDLDNSYLLVFGDGWIRFVQDGAYLVTAVGTTTSVVDGLVTLTSHGLADGNLVYLGGYSPIAVVDSATANTFQMVDIFTGASIDYDAGAVSLDVVDELVNPFAADDLDAVQYSQRLDVVKLTHVDYAPRLLTRSGGTFTIEVEQRDSGTPLLQTPVIENSGAFVRYIKVTDGGAGYSNSDTITLTDATGEGFQGFITVDSGVITAVDIVDGGRNFTGPTVVISGSTPSSAASFEVGLAETNAGFSVAVTAVFSDGKESGPTRPALVEDSINFTATQGFATYSWDPVDGAVLYNVYRSLVFPDGAEAHIGQELGYIGNTRATTFTDNNILPDFTRAPSFYFDPFAPGAIVSVDVTNGGSGYTKDSVITITDGGSGADAVVYPIVRDGEIVGVIIGRGGENYTSPSFSVSDGTGATFTIETTPTTGTYPAASFPFQRRDGYAGTTNLPMTFWASRIEDRKNHSTSAVQGDADPYSDTLDTEEVTPIRHLRPVQQGLLIMTNTDISLLRSTEGAQVTPNSKFLDTQSFIGANTVRPKVVDENILYISEQSTSVQMLTFNPVARRFDNREISINSRELFRDKVVKEMDFAYLTEKVGYGVFTDGSGFMVGMDSSQEVFGFTPMTTRGEIKDVAVLKVGTEEHVYFLVERKINGVITKSIERIIPAPTTDIEDEIFLDSALSIAKNFPAASVDVTGVEGEQTVTASSGVFAPGDVDSIIGIGGGRGVVTSYVSATEITANFTRPITRLAFEQDIVGTAAEGTWWLNPLVSTISNIPFENETVTVIADGKLQSSKTVGNGTITLDTAAAIVHIGFPYTARLITLPPAQVADGELYNSRGALVSYIRSGSFSCGKENNDLYDVSLRTTEPWNEPTELRSGVARIDVHGNWEADGGYMIESDCPFPCEISKITVFYQRGDTRSVLG